MLNQDHLFVVPIRDRWLIHAPLHCITALVNEAVVTRLRKGSQKSLDKNIKNLYASLNEAPTVKPIPNKGPLQPEFLGIISTRSCNLKCKYCGFGACEASSTDTMDLRLAAAAVDWMVDCVRKMGRKYLDIHFFGGEPLFASDVVDTVIHYARFCSMQSGLIPKFEIATNGVFDEDRCRFIGDYIDTVVLSFDGPEEIQDKYRPLKNGKGSYEIVARNAHLLSKAPSKFCIRTCVTQETVSYLDKVTEWVCRTFQPNVIDYEILRPTDESEAAGLIPPDPWEFAIMCIRAMRIAAKYGVMPVYAAASIEIIRHSFCPVGRDTVIVSPDRRINACYLLEQDWKNKDLDFNLGYINNSGTMNLDQSSVERVRRITTETNKCQRCLSRWHCAGGCRVSNSYPGCPDDYDNFCIQTRIITVCRLLQELGCDQEVRSLIEDREALECLALQDSDRLSDWEG